MRRETFTTKSLALFLIMALQVVLVQATLGASSARAQSGQLTGKLTTEGNQPVVVNGNSMTSGGTILTGAIIETPPGVSAQIDLGPLGSIHIAPGSQVVLDFSDGSIKLKVIRGCAILRSKKGTEGEVSTEQSVIATTDKKKDETINICVPKDGGSPIVSREETFPGTAASSEGLDRSFMWVGLGGGVGGGILAIILANRSSNATPS